LLLHDDFPRLPYFSKTELFDRIKNIALVLATSFSAWVIAHIIKDLVLRLRPFEQLDSMNTLIVHGGLDSFPSGHSTFFVALATAMYFRHRSVGMFFGIGALLIGISRIVVGVHFPVDILFGFILGIGIALGVEKSLGIRFGLQK